MKWLITSSLLVFALIAGTGCRVHVEERRPHRHHRHHPHPHHRHHGHHPAVDVLAEWKELGSVVVKSGPTDVGMVTIRVTPTPAKALRVAVSNSDFEMYDLVVVYDDGERLSLGVAHSFVEGARSVDINLPTGRGPILEVEISHKNLPAGSVADLNLFSRN